MGASRRSARTRNWQVIRASSGRSSWRKDHNRVSKKGRCQTTTCYFIPNSFISCCKVSVSPSSSQLFCLRGCTHAHHHLVTLLDKLMCYVATNKTGCPGHKVFHFFSPET